MTLLLSDVNILQPTCENYIPLLLSVTYKNPPGFNVTFSLNMLKFYSHEIVIFTHEKEKSAVNIFSVRDSFFRLQYSDVKKTNFT